MSIVPPGGSQTFKNHAQGIILPARMDPDATDKQYASGDVVVITDYMDSLNGTVIGGVSKNYGVFVAKSPKEPPMGRMAVVVDPIGEKSTGSVCVSGACLVKVNRTADSPLRVNTPLAGSLCLDSTSLEIGRGFGDVDIVWEENEEVEEHWAYVLFPRIQGVLLLKSTTDESDGKIDAKAVDSEGEVVGDAIEMLVIEP
jgi:hypothetical protein